MEYGYHACVVLFGIVGSMCIAYAAGAVRQAKAVAIALAGSITAAFVAAFAALSVGGIIFKPSGDWAGLGLLVGGAAAGALAGIVGFFVLLAVALKKLAPSPSQMPTVRRNISLGAGVASLIVVFFCVYQIVPLLHPTSKLIRDVRGSLWRGAKSELIRRGDVVLPDILDVLRGDPFGRRTEVYAEIIGHMRGKASTDALLALMEHPNPAVRALAAFRLSRRKERRALEPMVEMLSAPDLVGSHKGMTLSVIAKMGDPSVVPRMLEALDPPGSRPGGGAGVFSYDYALMMAMGALRHPESYEFFMELCSHPRAEIREDAVEQLAQYPCRRTTLALIDLMADPETSVRRKADWTMRRIAGEQSWTGGRIYSIEDSAQRRSHWVAWAEEQGESLPEEPAFEPSSGTE